MRERFLCIRPPAFRQKLPIRENDAQNLHLTICEVVPERDRKPAANRHTERAPDGILFNKLLLALRRFQQFFEAFAQLSSLGRSQARQKVVDLQIQQQPVFHSSSSRAFSFWSSCSRVSQFAGF